CRFTYLPIPCLQLTFDELVDFLVNVTKSQNPLPTAQEYTTYTPMCKAKVLETNSQAHATSCCPYCRPSQRRKTNHHHRLNDNLDPQVPTNSFNEIYSTVEHKWVLYPFRKPTDFS